MENGLTSVKNLVSEFRLELKAIYRDDEISQFIYMLFEEYMGWPKTKVHLGYNLEIPEATLALFTNALTELCTGKPIQYILGKARFNGTLLTVDARVLIPRPETEELCAIISSCLSKSPHRHPAVLDIGTGSGCIPIDLKKRFPDAVVTGIDSSPGILEIALKNARENRCDIYIVLSDILKKEDQSMLGQFNVIVSNPPYVPEGEKILMSRNVTAFEPSQALFVADSDPLRFYEVITDFAVSHLTRPGHLFFEINERYGQEVRYLVHSFGFSEVVVLKDIHGKDRFVSAILF